MVLSLLVGPRRSLELLLSADVFEAARLYEMGLINRLAKDADELAKFEAEFVDRLAALDPLAVKLTKKAINDTLRTAGMEDALRAALQTDIEIETTETPESRAFNEILKSRGLKAALAWRAAQLPDTKE